ncbi:MAG: cysteine hydrolase [Comamonadaceae bacterium]|nr:MAG: cysteine hydrolase [Comamonadaceae bacterium]
MIEARRTALVVVDVQNDFAHADGVMGRFGVDLSSVDAAVDRVQDLLDAAHAAGVQVFLVRLQTSAARDSRAANLRRARTGRSVPEDLRVCREGRWGADFYRIAPAAGDVEVAKWRYSSFGGTGLDLQLRALGLDTLVVCGLTTECCVETTVRDAFALDFHVFVAADASTAYDRTVHDVAIDGMVRNFAIRLETPDIVAAWRAAVDAR